MNTNRLNEEIITFVCSRIDKINNVSKENKKYSNYKAEEQKIFEELKTELTEEQKTKLTKLSDFNYRKEACLEENLYKQGFCDGIILEQRLKEREDII